MPERSVRHGLVFTTGVAPTASGAAARRRAGSVGEPYRTDPAAAGEAGPQDLFTETTGFDFRPPPPHGFARSDCRPTLDERCAP